MEGCEWRGVHGGVCHEEGYVRAGTCEWQGVGGVRRSVWDVCTTRCERARGGVKARAAAARARPGFVRRPPAPGVRQALASARAART